jgi:hypothetical protein
MNDLTSVLGQESELRLDHAPLVQSPAQNTSRVLGCCSPCLKAPRKSSGFFVPLLLHTAIADTLQATGAEDKPLRGRKLSADSGAKTRLGFGEPLSPSGGIESLGLASTRKIPGG